LANTHYKLTFSTWYYLAHLPGQVENAETETEVRKRKYGNGNTEVIRKAACRWPAWRMCLVGNWKRTMTTLASVIATLAAVLEPKIRCH